MSGSIRREVADVLSAAARSDHVPAVAGTPAAVLFQERGQEGVHLQAGGDAPIAQKRRWLEQHFGEDLNQSIAVKWRLTHHAFEKKHAEREHIDARIEVTAASRLFGSHVARRSEHLSRSRQALDVFSSPSDSEIHDGRLQELTAHQNQIAGLDVAMNDAASVNRPQRFGDPLPERQRLLDRKRPTLQACFEILPFEPLHRDVWLTGVRDSVRDMADDGRMLDGFECGCFAQEAFDLGARVGNHHFESDRDTALEILRPEDSTHAARRNLALDAKPICNELPR